MKKRPLYLPFAGPALLEAPLLNKGSAFTQKERQRFNLEGLLPHNIETIDEQCSRLYEQFASFDSAIDKHIYLRNIQDTNETAYYYFLKEHLEEVMPLIYTPTVGQACQMFSKIYRRKRGLFISYPDRDRIDDMLQNATKQNVKVIVVTDGERILGLGDLGIGGMGIPIGKLALYTACGGISSAYTLPVVLDVGTNNQDLIDDPMYMGWRHERIKGDEYYEFVEQFITAVKVRWPDAMLQFEDFAGHTATPLLERYRDELCCFNDDIQGTASVTVGTLLAACHAKDEALKDQRIVFCGAGSAGCGIAGQIIAQMKAEGLNDLEARKRIFMVNIDGLLTEKSENLLPFQLGLRQDSAELSNWSMENTKADNYSLYDVVANAKPTILVGVSGAAGMFNKDLIETMYESCDHPIILPLSNPTSKVEAVPSDILRWTCGDAIIATGSPFDPVDMGDRTIAISQCNNSYIFPGVGLGVVASKARRITDNMMMASSKALAECSPLVKDGVGELLPALGDIREVSKIIAKAVYLQAMEDGVAAKVSEELIDANIAKNFWEPEYREYRRTSF